jgi:hypothetical protein
MNKVFILISIILLSIISSCITTPAEQKKTPISTITTTANMTSCDESLWSHVWYPPRLQVIERCRVVTGIVENISIRGDGDEHISLKLDPEYTNLVNQKNIDEQHGYLVLEIICKNPIRRMDELIACTKEDTEDTEGHIKVIGACVLAFNACNGFKQDFEVNVGEHIRVTGAYVLDSEHGWNEIHPITSIVKIG